MGGEGLGGVCCFKLEYKMYVPGACLKKGVLKPHYYYYLKTLMQQVVSTEREEGRGGGVVVGGGGMFWQKDNYSNRLRSTKQPENPFFTSQSNYIH